MSARHAGGIVIVDYGMGNIASIRNMISRLGHHAELSSDAKRIHSARQLILPGVGAFDEAMRCLRQTDLAAAVRDAAQQGASILGICLGMQVLLEGSDEGVEPGLGLIKGRVRRFPPEVAGNLLRVPHMGWSDVELRHRNPWLATLGEPGQRFYFVHSYYADPVEPEAVVATSRYGIDFACAIGSGRVVGVQFHPEKSHRHGMAVLAGFLRGPSGA